MPTTSTPLTTTGVVIEVMAGDEGVIRKQGQQSHSDRQQQIEAKLDQVDTFAKGGGGRGKVMNTIVGGFAGDGST